MSRSDLSSRRARRIVAVLVVVAVVVAAAAAGRAQSASATVRTLKQFTVPGSYDWKVPAGVTTVTFDAFGAQGGGVIEHVGNHMIQTISTGGPGGEAKGTFKVTAGEQVRVVVGGQGGTATLGVAAATGGLNGGGAGDIKVGSASGGGGGASDVRIGGRGNNCVSVNFCTFPDRIVVGGGGGGGSANGVNGSVGGGLTGGGSEGGAQEFGGACGTTPLVVFGYGANSASYSGIGGGGAGWYGGGCNTSGGGGSGYIGRFSTGGSFPGGTETGDGKVIITTTS